MFARRFFENAPLVGKFPFLKPASFSVAEMKALLEVNKPLSAVVDEAFRCEDVDAWKREDTSEVLVSERIGLGAGYKLDIEARFQPHTDIWGGDRFYPDVVVGKRRPYISLSMRPEIDADIADTYQPESHASLTFSIDGSSRRFDVHRVTVGNNYPLSDTTSTQAYLKVFFEAVAFAQAPENDEHNRGLEIDTNFSRLIGATSLRNDDVPPLKGVTQQLNTAVRSAYKELGTRKRNGIVSCFHIPAATA